MAKEQPIPVELLEDAVLFFLRQKESFPYTGKWIIYSKTKYGDKCFGVYFDKESATNAAKYYRLNIQIE